MDDHMRFVKNSLIIIKHIIKSVIELIRHLLDLELLTVDLIFNVINSVVELGDVHLSVFITSLSMLESVHKLVNFVLELKLIFLYSQFPGQLIEFLFIITGHLGGFPEILVCLFNLNLIPHGLVLKVLDLLENTISILGCHGKLGDSFGKGRVSLLCFFLHQHDTSGQCADLFLCILESLFLLFQSSQSLGQFVICFVKLYLISLNLLSQVTDISLVCVISGISLFCVCLVSGNGGQK